MSEGAGTPGSFYRALWAGNDIGPFLDDRSFLHVPGRTEIAGDFKGRDAIVSLFTKMQELTGGTLRPYRPDTVDILVGEAHCALLDRLVAEREDGRRLDSFQMCLTHVEEGKLGSSFVYLEDPEGFEAFWS